MIRRKPVEETYPENSFALELFSSDSYFTVNKKLLQHYGPDMAIFISNLIDKYKYFLSQDMIEEDWFYVISQQQMEDTGLTLYKLQTCKSSFVNEGILEIKRKGVPSKEWFHLDFDLLLEVIHPKASLRETQRLAYGKPKGLYIRNNKPKNNKPKTLSPPQKNELNYLPLANTLADIVSFKKKIKILPKSINSWAKEFKLLIEINEVSLERVQEVLEWYRDHLGDKYIPVAESGASFREKFIRIEDAMNKENKEIPSTQSFSHRTNRIGAYNPEVTYKTPRKI